MIMTLPAPTAEPAQHAASNGALRIIVVLLALIEILRGLADLPILFDDIAKIPGFTLYGLMTIATIVLHPILGLAAFALALARRPRHAIVALAVFILAHWASENSTVFRDGLQIIGGDAFVTSQMAFNTFGQPLIAIGAIAAAWCNRYLALAAVAVIVPAMLDLIGFIAFAVAVSNHGF
jgi:hypothetical protein